MKMELVNFKILKNDTFLFLEKDTVKKGIVEKVEKDVIIFDGNKSKSVDKIIKIPNIELSDISTTKFERAYFLLWLKENYKENYIKTKDIKEKFGYNRNTIARWLKKLGLYMTKEDKKKYIKDNYFKKDFNLEKTSKRINLTEDMVKYYISEMELYELKQNNIKENAEKWLKKNFKTTDKTIKEICIFLDISMNQFYKFKEDFNLERNHSLRNKHFVTEWLDENFEETEKTDKEIAEYLNVSPTTVYEKKKQLGLKTENLTDWLIKNYKNKYISMEDIIKKTGQSKKSIQVAISYLGLMPFYQKIGKWVKDNYVKSGLTDTEVANKLKVSEKTIQRKRWELNIPPNKLQKLTKKDIWLMENIDDLITSKKELAEYLGVTVQGLHYILNKLNLELKDKYTKAEEFIREKFNKNPMNDEEVAKKFNVSHYTIARYRKKYGYKPYKESVMNEVEEWLIEHYSNWRKTIAELSTYLDIAVSTIYYYVNLHDLKRKTKFELLYEWVKNNYKQSVFTDKEIAENFEVSVSTVKKYCSELHFNKNTNKRISQNKKERIISVPLTTFYTSHYKKHYPNLYNFLRKEYCGFYSVKEIAIIYNIPIEFLEKIMEDINVNGYEKYSLTPKQIRWIKQEYMTKFMNIKDIKNNGIFNPESFKEFKRFIKNKN